VPEHRQQKGSPRLCAEGSYHVRLGRTTTCDYSVCMGRTAGFAGTASERLSRNLVRQPNGCLEWTGSRQSRGYGHLRVNGKLILAPRLAWSLVNGPITDGLRVCHRCDNPLCCETEPSDAYPEGHLFLGTHYGVWYSVTCTHHKDTTEGRER